jgi:hypothetical protein
MRKSPLYACALLVSAASFAACGSEEGADDDVGQSGSSGNAGTGGKGAGGKSGSGGSGGGAAGKAGGSGGSGGGDAGEAGAAGAGGGDDGGAGGAGAEAGASGAAGADGGGIPFEPSNLPEIETSGTGELVLREQDCVIDTDDGTIDCAEDAALYAFSTASQEDGPELAVFAVRSLVIEQSAQVRVVGSRPLVFFARETIDIRGGLEASAAGHVVNGGGFAQTPTGKGGGLGGGAAARNYAAGGGGAYCGKGGLGGFEADDPPASVGGEPFGAPELVPLFGGAAGGGDQDGTEGGAGGGAIQLVAGVAFTLGTNGYVSAGGGGGEANGGGAGSGGAILIESPDVTINGTLAANGGGGALFNGGSSGQAGQPGDTAALGSAVTAGIGSAGDVIDGGAGSNDGMIANTSGGGGGGAGRIRINTAGGTATFGDDAVVSPGRETECVSEGELASGS